MKYCPHCKSHVNVHVAEKGAPLNIPGEGVLIRLLSPGETHLNRVYTCDSCHGKINGMTLWNAILVPLLILSFFVGSVVLFITIILTFVS